jgi:hypothetical protein
MIKLTKRYNADNTLSVLARGRVVLKCKLGWHSDADTFAIGWYGDNPVVWNRPQFRLRKKI